MKRGIDLSSYNGSVDMNKVKQQGINFIILRVGIGGDGVEIDKKFYDNYEKANKVEIPIGVYLYSYACNRSQAVNEANGVLKIIKDLIIEYPIFIDMEDADNYKRNNNIQYTTCVDICESFCETIEKAGYYAGIYANLDWLNNKINDPRLDRFDKWVAQWGDFCTYKKHYGIWQNSSEGLISGINGSVDLDYSFKDYQSIIRNNGLNNLNIQILEHTVKEGENLTVIGRKYNKSWEEIYNLNRKTIGNNPNYIKVGQKLIIGVKKDGRESN